jgi:hypothetical protein
MPFDNSDIFTDVSELIKQKSPTTTNFFWSTCFEAMSLKPITGNVGVFSLVDKF